MGTDTDERKGVAAAMVLSFAVLCESDRAFDEIAEQRVPVSVQFLLSSLSAQPIRFYALFSAWFVEMLVPALTERTFGFSKLPAGVRSAELCFCR
jgi:hypothetical protein